MATREEIRGEMFDIVKPYVKMHNDAVSCSWKLFHYLRDNDVVIKISKEMPINPKQTESWDAYEEARKARAKYAMVEPLIKE